MSYTFFRALLRLIYKVLFRVKAYGVEHIPDEGPVIIAANHISLLDPPQVGILIKRKVHFMAKEELFKVPVFGSLIRSFGAYPVKRGSGLDAVKNSIKLLKDNKVMGIFPEGTRNNSSDEAKKGTAMIALRSKAQVVPAAIVGEYKLFQVTKVIYGPPIDVISIAENVAEGVDKYDAVTEAIMLEIDKLKRS